MEVDSLEIEMSDIRALETATADIRSADAEY